MRNNYLPCSLLLKNGETMNEWRDLKSSHGFNKHSMSAVFKRPAVLSTFASKLCLPTTVLQSAMLFSDRKQSEFFLPCVTCVSLIAGSFVYLHYSCM